MAVYAPVLILTLSLLKKGAALGEWRYALAVLPAAPLVGAIVALGLYVRSETDEYIRARFVEGLLWAMGGTLVITTVLGFLEAFGGLPQTPMFYVFVIWAGLVGAGSLVTNLRHR